LKSISGNNGLKKWAHKSVFFIQQATGTEQGRPRTVKSCIGELIITEKQAEKLDIKKSTRLSPLFEKCCLRQIANLSYSKAAKEMEVQTGVKIGHTCLHRLVEKQEWSEPYAKIEVKETSIDGGKVRVRGDWEKGLIGKIIRR
jgi:hypothetical protein